MGELFTKRELLEEQEPATLLEHKQKLLSKLSDLEREVHLVNEVLDGYGVRHGETILALGKTSLAEVINLPMYSEYDYELETNIERGRD